MYYTKNFQKYLHVSVRHRNVKSNLFTLKKKNDIGYRFANQSKSLYIKLVLQNLVCVPNQIKFLPIKLFLTLVTIMQIK